MAFSTGMLLVSGAAIIVCDQAGAGFWGTVIPLWLFMTACGFTFPCVQVLALDRHGKAAGTAASVLGACNFGVAAIISPAVGMISEGSGITATTMAIVMVGCAVIAILALWLIVRPSTVEMLAP
jgi:DHA1 family bicyclomycin/chloramphenicol resistance-like MFS transporter